jgi:signal transduction histidine kinase/CheY-like chemotaxis protein
VEDLRLRRITLIGLAALTAADLFYGTLLRLLGLPPTLSLLVGGLLIAATGLVLAYRLLIRDLLSALRTTIEETKRIQRDMVVRLDFLATITHEVRTPLNGIIGMSDLLRRDPSPQTVRSNVDLIWNNSNTLLRLINDILDFSKIQADSLVLEDIEFDLSEVIHRVAASNAAVCFSKGVELVLDLRLDSARTVRGDPTRVAQVLSNLVNNAIKFTDNGHIILRVREVGRQGDRTRVSFSVTDTGIGISADRIPQLFERYAQEEASTSRQFGGTGLGLAICKSLVHAMGGRIGVTSMAGEGSAFFFSLLFGRTHPSVAPEPRPLTGLTIGLVVDHPALWEALTSGLNRRGAAVVDSRSAGAPIRLNETSQAYHALVIDQDLDSGCGCVKLERLRHLPEVRDAALILLKAPVETPTAISRSEHVPPRGITELIKPLSSDDVADKIIDLVKQLSGDTDAPEMAENTAAALEGVRVLVADDNVVNRQIMDKMLHVLGAEIDLVEDGEQAAQAVRNSRYDVVLMDIQMPVLDGLEATRVIRGSSLPEQPVILGVSGATSEAEQTAARDSGMDGYLTKPIVVDTLVSSIRSHVPHPRQSPE